MLKIKPIFTKVSTDGRFNITIEHQADGIYSNCFEVILLDNNIKQGANAFSTFNEALDFVYSLIKAHAREGIKYNS